MARGGKGGSGYDPDKDEVVETFLEKKLGEGRGMRVAAMSYDEGPIRVVIQNSSKNKDGEKRYYNANRLNGDQLGLVIKGLKKAREWYEENEDEVEKRASNKKDGPEEKSSHKHKKHHPH